jgi:hypothetical protein
VVYDTGGNRSGRVQGFTEHGFEVEREDTSTVSFEHDPGGFGEGYMMWRSSNCGEMGKLQSMPDTCPNCGYGAEFLYAWPRIDRLGERFYALTTN